MTIRIGINGFGRVGRLAFRALLAHSGAAVTHINEPHADAGTCAHLLTFDSVHGRLSPEAEAGEASISVAGRRTTLSAAATPDAIGWPGGGVDVVLECSGRFRTPEAIAAHLEAGAGAVAVAAPVRGEGVPDIVMGVNDHLIAPGTTRLATAASCTTNCLAPVVKVIHEGIGIRHGAITTLHDLTNTQSVVDAPHADLRRARAASLSLIPTSTGSATAIGRIFPDLQGRLDGIAVRVPLLNSSLTDCVFEVARPTDTAEVNGLLAAAAADGLDGILGYEERPLVSVDFRGDPRSGVVDAACTRVTGGTQVKVMAWYDNEWGYANRLVELALLMAGRPTPAAR